MEYWFTSDHHFSHSKILEYCERPFSNIQGFTKTYIKNHNDIVKEKNIVFFLGDVGFTSSKELEDILKQLNGIKILIKGNHDR